MLGEMVRIWGKKTPAKFYVCIHRSMENLYWKSIKIIAIEKHELMEADLTSSIPRLLYTSGGFWPMAFLCELLLIFTALCYYEE